MQDKQVALVTGANQGIGLQFAKGLIAEGLAVLIGSRNPQRSAAAATELGPNAFALQLDVTDQASITKAAEQIRQESGRPDVLIQKRGNYDHGRPSRTNASGISGGHPDERLFCLFRVGGCLAN